jgi:hypothetical protein
MAAAMANFAVACFTARTPIVVDHAGNSKPVEELEVGDVLLARNEFDPAGPLELQRVEEKCVREAAVMELVVRGRSIKTTAEHPFFVPAQNRFVPAGELKAGDQLVSSSGELISIDSVSPLSELTTVYNLRVADFHTYFVGGALWTWDVWVHNAYKFTSNSDVSGALGNNMAGSERGGQMMRSLGFEAAHVVPWDLERAEPLRQFLMKNGWTLDDVKFSPVNGVWLPGPKLKDFWIHPTWHRGGSQFTPSTSKHSQEAMEEIMAQLKIANGDKFMIDHILQSIGHSWQNAEWSL